MRTRGWISLLLFAVSAGCGGSPAPKVVEDPGDTGPTAKQGYDQAFEFEREKLQGVFFEPEALYTTAMPAPAGGKRTVAAQKKAYERAKGDAKIKEGALLAGKLWGVKDGQEEARQILRDITAGGEAPEYVLVMLAVAEEYHKDYKKAGEVYDQILERFPESEDLLKNKAKRAFYALVNGNNKRAVEVLAGTEGAEKAPADLHYVRAWVAFRQGDYESAFQSISKAAAAWKDKSSIPAVQRDLLLLGSRAGVAPQTVLDALGKLYKDYNKVAVLDQLAKAYLFAGHYQRQAEALELVAADAQPVFVAQVRLVQSDDAFKLNDPSTAADYILKAWEAAGKAEKIQPDLKEAIANRILQYAQVFHAVYARSFDETYYEPARRLYEAYLGIPDGAKAAEAKSNFENLQKTKEVAGDRLGEHDRDEFKRRMLFQREKVSACYEKVLQRNPTLAGNVDIVLDVGHDGVVKSTDTDPKAGDMGLGAVARCLTETMSKWTFHKRAREGISRTLYRFELSPAAREEG